MKLFGDLSVDLSTSKNGDECTGGKSMLLPDAKAAKKMKIKDSSSRVLPFFNSLFVFID